MRPWRASLPRSKQSGSMRLGSAPAQTRGRRCSSISRCSTIGSGCTQPWATALRLRRGPAWRRSPCALRRDILIYPLHTKGGGPINAELSAIPFKGWGDPEWKPLTDRCVALRSRIAQTPARSQEDFKLKLEVAVDTAGGLEGIEGELS